MKGSLVCRSFGPLNVTLEVARGSGLLLAVNLPPLPPAGLSSRDLHAALQMLRPFPIFPAASAAESNFRDALQAIPPGQTRTYAQVAAGLQTAPRAIGRRCAQNRLLLRIPCHRIVAKNTSGGFNAGMAWKQTLLALEKELGVFALSGAASQALLSGG